MNRRILKRFISFSLILAATLQAHEAQALQNKPRLMFMTSSYGVMLGSLAGVASLAFYKSPGNHTRNVALGASLGLYAGILLGVYMLYLKSDPTAPSDAPAEGAGESSLSTLSSSLYATNGSLDPTPALLGAYGITDQDTLIMPAIGSSMDGRAPLLGLTIIF